MAEGNNDGRASVGGAFTNNSAEGKPDGQISIGNEFTNVELRKVLTRNGERVEIFSPRMGYAIRLDPLELESLTWQDARTFSLLLKSPYGPEEEDVEIRPLSELMLLAREDE
jgi:hypothetical protein